MNFSNSDITTLEAVARFFGCTLQPQETGYRYTLPVCSAYALHVRRDYHTKKARFIAILPEGMLSTGHVDGINVSLERPALALAKDIQRRLIPAAVEWAKRCRDHTAAVNREKEAVSEFLARIFAANRSEVKEYGHRNGWRGKGFEIGIHHTGPSHWGEYEATVRVRSIQALEQIAAICAEDFEFHAAKPKQEETGHDS